ncbi:MAG TPA: Gfo/Idh/MocA family oxidoreductase [Vicinamibacterales bacterium]|nr:Gfo/Idh/MocA family oxidoreductase [Vicinamibacterales bacterium]
MSAPFDRRDFLKSAAGTLTLLLSRGGLSAAQTPAAEPPAGPPVTIGVIGLGPWGRETLAALGRIPQARVGVLCDVYEPFLKRAAPGAPNATAVTDWRRALEAPVDAIVVATPTPLHREIVEAALQAGKHVYCEAPLAASIDDARAIARAAGAASGRVFQAGLQGRANALYTHVLQFVKTGVLGGELTLVNAQWNRKESWRRPAPTPEREAAVNWRLARESPGLMGEVGIHQLDLVMQYLDARPTAIVGAGAIAAWRDGRQIPDSVVSLIEFPKARATFRVSLASSFGGAYTIFQGSDSSLLMKESRGWMIKEADSPLLGWEVYARKEPVHDEMGIAMVADATKLLQAGVEPGKSGAVEPEKPPLVMAYESFIRSIQQSAPPAAGAKEGFAATVAALKANEAALAGGRVEVAADAYDV